MARFILTLSTYKRTTTTFIIVLCLSFAHKSKAQAIELNADNDFLIWYDQSDRYYTYGLSIAFHNRLGEKRLEKHPLKKIFPKSNNLIESLSFNSQGYTPSNYKEMKEKDKFDRPFAGRLFVNYALTSQIKHYSVKIGLNAGVLGPFAQAGQFQNWFHKKVGFEQVEGWDNQVSNQLGVSLNINMRKTLATGDAADIILEQSLSFGSIFTNISTRARIRIGQFNNIHNTSLYKTHIESESKNEYFLTFAGGAKFIGYDATLQGGIFNNSYFSASEISRIVGLLDLGAHVNVEKLAMSFSIIFSQNESTRTLGHKYGQIRLIYDI